MSLFIALLALSQVQPHVQDTIVDEAPARAHLWPGASTSTRFDDGAVAAGHVALSYRVADWLAPELLASAGVYAAPDAWTTPELVDRFSIGTRVIYPIDIVEPFLWVALHHEHQTQWSALSREPVAAVFGLSQAGVVHKTGAELALGVALPVDVDRTRTLLSGRVGVTALPSFGAHGQKDELALFMDLGAGLPLHF